MLLRGSGGDAEGERDLLVRRALRDQGKHLALPGGERERLSPQRRWRALADDLAEDAPWIRGLAAERAEQRAMQRLVARKAADGSGETLERAIGQMLVGGERRAPLEDPDAERSLR